MKLTKGNLLETLRRKNEGGTTYQARKIAGISIRRVNQVWNTYLATGITPVLRDFFYRYHPQRIARGIKANLLFNNNLRKEAKYLALPPVEVKFLPPDFKSPLQITFYKNKLYISLWEEKPIGFLIESERLVKAFKVYFDTLWKQTK